MKILQYLILLFNLSFYNAYCQDFGMYWNDFTHINPGNYGLINRFQGTTQYKSQWGGFSGSPKEHSTTFNCRIKPFHGGVGFNHQYEQIGAYENDFLLIGYSFHISFKNDSRLGIGTSVGIDRYRFDNNTINGFRDTDTDGQLDDLPANDDYLKQIHGDIRLGLAYTSINIETGLSFRRSTYLARTLCFGYFAYKINLSPKIYLKPGLAVNTIINDKNNSSEEKISNVINVNLTLTMLNKLWFGSLYSSRSRDINDGLGFYVGYDIIGYIRVGYLYFRRIDEYSSGTHELVISFKL